MRLASYNILDGGEGRADPIAEVLLAQRADIVGLVEADNPAALERIAARLRMDYVVASGESHAVALLSRWRIGDTVNHAAIRSGGPRCLLSAEVQPPRAEPWRVGVVHLSPRAYDADECRREMEIAALLDVFAPDRGRRRPHILMGDFNANAPCQRIDPARCKERTRQAWAANGGGIPRRVIQRMLEAGYVDTLQAARPAEAETAGSFTTQHPGQRVDYIFVHGINPSSIRDAWIEHDRLAKYASDHFPVGAEVEAGG